MKRLVARAKRGCESSSGYSIEDYRRESRPTKRPIRIPLALPQCTYPVRWPDRTWLIRGGEMMRQYA